MTGETPPNSAKEVEVAAPLIWRNWRAALTGARPRGMVELKLYTDAWIIADAAHGPYAFLNTVPSTGPDGSFGLTPSIALRVDHHLAPELNDMSVTSDEHYHGGWLYDEVAALASLILGARIVAGDVDREFGFYHDDPLGRPRGQATALLPQLPSRGTEPQIPWLFETRDLRELGLLETLPALGAADAIALIKSARLFQQALWVSDTAPEIAWLLLVSAAETAANRWNASTIAPVDRLERSYPRLHALLAANSEPGLLEAAAAELAPLTGATGKFIGFCSSFRPEPPERRPKFGRFDFAAKPFKAAVAQIYRYRSRALHGGIPFPNPMCRPPMRGETGNEPREERPTGLGAGALGATWIADDLPMHLHLFAYIARQVLLGWWRSISDPSADGPEA